MTAATDVHPGSFAVLLKRFRSDAGLTQEELAERAQLSPKAVSSLERGARRRPHRVTVALLIEALELDGDQQARLELAARGASQEQLRGADRVELPAGAFLGSAAGGRFVARDAEVQSIARAVLTAHEGQGRTVLLAGEAGIGKTRLAQETHLRLRRDGFLTAVGRCYQPRASVPYFPFLEALGGLFDSAPDPVRASATRRWPSLAPLLPDRLGFARAPDRPEDQALTFRAAAAFLAELATVGPIGILVDDLQWADGSSVRLLHHLARETRNRPVFLMATYRDTDLPGEPALAEGVRDLVREGLAESINLGRLDLDATRELIVDLAGEPDMSDELGDFIFHRAEGNPYYVRQLVGALGSQASGEEVTGPVVPDTIRALVRQRVNILGDTDREILTRMSVLGQVFSFEDGLSVTDEGEEALERSLTAASSRGLIRETGPERYAFDHGLTQQTLYESLSGRGRRRIHESFGRRLASLSRREQRGRLAELAWHLGRGGDGEGALHWSLEAGANAASLSALAEARHHYETAARLAGDLDRADVRARALEGLGHALHALGLYDEARTSLEEADQLFARGDDELGRARVSGELGGVYRMLGRADESIAIIESALARLGDRAEEDGSPTAELHADLAQLLWPVGRRTEALAAATKASALATKTGDRRIRAWADMQQARMLERLGRRSEALAAAEGALDRVEPDADQGLLWYCLSVLTAMYEARGEWVRAQEMIDRSIEAAERRGDPQYHAASLARLGGWLTWRGDWPAAQQALDRALACVSSEDRIAGFIAVTQARLQLWRGDHAGLRTQLEAVIADAEEAGNIDGAMQATMVLTELLNGEGCFAESLRLLEGFAQREEVLENDPVFGALLVDAHLGVGDVAAARQLCSHLMRTARGDDLKTPLIDLHRLSAEIALASLAQRAGKSEHEREVLLEAARADAQESATLARALGCPYKESLAQRAATAVAAQNLTGRHPRHL